jgi:hypothetical protein
VDHAETDEAIMQRILEESLKDAQPSSGDDMDPLLAAAVANSLASPSRFAARTDDAEEAILQKVMEDSLKQAGASSSALPPADTATTVRQERLRSQTVDRLLSNSTDEDEDFLEAIRASMVNDQAKLARQAKQQNRKLRKKDLKNQRTLPKSHRRLSHEGEHAGPLDGALSAQRPSAGALGHYAAGAVSEELPSMDGRLRAVMGSVEGARAPVPIKEMKAELNRLNVPYTDCITRADIEERLRLAKEALGLPVDTPLKGHGVFPTPGMAGPRQTSMEEAMEVAETVEREDLLQSEPLEVRLKCEVMFAEAMSEYKRFAEQGNRRNARMVGRPQIREILQRARMAVKTEQQARVDEAEQARLQEERQMREIMESMEREEMLEALDVATRTEAERIFDGMMRDHAQKGGQIPRMEYAIALAKDQQKEKERVAREAAEADAAQARQAEERIQLEQAEAARAQKEAEDNRIQARNNESREARAARFAAMYEKKK